MDRGKMGERAAREGLFSLGRRAVFSKLSQDQSESHPGLLWTKSTLCTNIYAYIFKTLEYSEENIVSLILLFTFSLCVLSSASPRHNDVQESPIIRFLPVLVLLERETKSMMS